MRLFSARHIRSREDENAHTHGEKCLHFEWPSADVLVFREDDPAVGADDPEPFFVG